MMRVLTTIFGLLAAGTCLGQSQLVLTSLHEDEYIEMNATRQLDLTQYFQFYPEPGPVATFTINMPELDDGEIILNYPGRQPTPIVRYKLHDGGTYDDPYAVNAGEYLWSEYQVEFQLLAEAVPNTVANFMRYVSEGAYTNTIVHRNESTGHVFSPQASDSVFAGLPFTPLPIIQMGGFRLYEGEGYILDLIDGYSPVVFEENGQSTQGTLAMARSTTLDSATTQFFINLEDNSANWGANYSVYGELIDPDNSLPILEQFANAPVYNLSSPYSNGNPNIFPTLPFETIPLYAPFPLEKSSYARISSITVPAGDPAGVTYSWEWVSAYTDPTDEQKADEEAHQAVFDISIDGTTLNIARHDTGVARIRVIGTDGGDQVSEFAFNIAGYNQKALDTFPVSSVYQGGWLENTWYGWLLADTFPEIYHLNHRYQYISESSTSAIFYIFDYGLNSWLYTTSARYPYMYSFRLNTWLLYQLGSGADGNPRWFFVYDGDNSRWALETDI